MIALLHGADAFGAVERYVAALAVGLRERNEPAVLIYPDVAALEPFRELGGGSVLLEPLPPGLAAPRVCARLVRDLRRIRPRLAHITDVWPSAQVAARLAGIPRVLVTHHTPELPLTDNAAGRAWRRLGWLVRPEVIYTSQSDRAFDGRRTLTTHVVALGIDLDRFRGGVRAQLHGAPVIGNIARLEPQKGHRILIEAAKAVTDRHPDAQFVVVGDGTLRGELERRVENAALGDRFVFLGQRDDVPELLATFDVFAFPSLFEGLCLAVIEAQAAGVPVVATPVGGIRETVVPDETGVLCQPGDAHSLAEGIIWVLDHPEQACHLASEASRRAERYSELQMVERTLALYT